MKKMSLMEKIGLFIVIEVFMLLCFGGICGLGMMPKDQTWTWELFLYGEGARIGLIVGAIAGIFFYFQNMRETETAILNREEQKKKAEKLYEEGYNIFLTLGFTNIIHVDGSPLQLAAERFAKATKLNPNHGLAWFRLGQCMNMAGAKDEALKCFNTALKTELDTEWRTSVEDEIKKLA